MLPVRNKPSRNHTHKSYVTEIPNALDDVNIKALREFTMEDYSGFHRRGSKAMNTHASFYTCLFTDTRQPVYEILNKLWEPYTSITFIEPYEIKLYVEGDEFEPHTDSYYNIDEGVCRTMNMIIQLSDSSEYSGGDLVVGDYKCTRDLGAAIIFPAFLYHHVTEVTSGNRYSLIGHGWKNFSL